MDPEHLLFSKFVLIGTGKTKSNAMPTRREMIDNNPDRTRTFQTPGEDLDPVQTDINETFRPAVDKKNSCSVIQLSWLLDLDVRLYKIFRLTGEQDRGTG